MTRAFALFAAALTASSLGACSSPTELMLVVKAGPGLQIGNGAVGSIDTLIVQAGPRTGDFFYSKTIDLCTQSGQPNCRPQEFASQDYMDGLTLPIQLLLEPGNQGLDDEIHVWVDGYKSTGEHQISSGVHFSFSKGKRLWIELPLFGECVGDLDCEPSDTACIATGSDRNCVDIMPTTHEPDMATAPSSSDLAGADFSVDDGGLVMKIPDGGIHPVDGGADLSTSQDMHAEGGVDMSTGGDGGSTCQAGQMCVNGKCVDKTWLLSSEPSFPPPEPDAPGCTNGV